MLFIATDGGIVKLFETENFEEIGQITVQQNDITALIYMKPSFLVIGQVKGYIDVLHFTGNKPTLTHSLYIDEAGDIN